MYHTPFSRYSQVASVDSRDKQGRTPLFLAAEHGGTEAVKILINNGANMRAKDVDLRSCVRVAVGNAAQWKCYYTG